MFLGSALLGALTGIAATQREGRSDRLQALRQAFAGNFSDALERNAPAVRPTAAAASRVRPATVAIDAGHDRSHD